LKPPQKVTQLLSCELAKTLNPYQGLKREPLLVLLRQLWSELAKTLNPYQGLKLGIHEF
jgi:hypothetical protein